MSGTEKSNSSHKKVKSNKTVKMETKGEKQNSTLKKRIFKVSTFHH